MDHRVFGFLVVCAVLLSACGATASAAPATQSTRVPAAATRSTRPSAAPATAAPAIIGIEAASFAPANVERMRSAGAAWTRRNALQWSAVEPNPGDREWAAVAPLEQDLRSAAGRGLNVILIVRSAPDWARLEPDVPCGPVRDDRLAALGAFMRDVAIRYGAASFNITHFELWNEPDVDIRLVPPDSPFGCWGDGDDPYFGGERYARALKAIYPQVKSGNPRAQVVFGGLLLDCAPDHPPEGQSCQAGRFLDGVLRAGGGAFFDVVSFHAYDFWQPGTIGGYVNPNWRSTSGTTGPVISAKAAFIRRTLDRYGLRKRIMNTESGVLCWECATTSADFETTKAYYVAQASAASQAIGLAANVWYSLEGWFGTALIDGAGQPTPAYAALQVAGPILGSATFRRRIDDASGLLGYEFTVDGRRTWIIWSLDGQPHPLRLLSAPTRAFDVFGKAVSTGRQLIVDARPVYLQWGS
jgi:hypothetical protein